MIVLDGHSDESAARITAEAYGTAEDQAPRREAQEPKPAVPQFFDLTGHSHESAEHVMLLAIACGINDVDDDAWDTCPGPRCYSDRIPVGPDGIARVSLDDPHHHVDKDEYRENLRAAKAEVDEMRAGQTPVGRRARCGGRGDASRCGRPTTPRLFRIGAAAGRGRTCSTPRSPRPRSSCRRTVPGRSIGCTRPSGQSVGAAPRATKHKEAAGMSEAKPRPVVVDGPALKAIRRSQGVTVRRMALMIGVSHGHVSKVERGEYGRPVTPAMIHAYGKALCLDVTQVIADGRTPKVPGKPKAAAGWRSGQLDQAERQQLIRKITAAAAVSGAVRSGVELGRLLGSPGVDLGDPATLAVLERLVDVLDQHGEPAGPVAHYLLRWAIRWPGQLADADDPHPESLARVGAMIVRLARRAAHGAEAAGRVEATRSLYLLALVAAAGSGNPDLRTAALADLAEQQTQCGYPEDALAVLRLATGEQLGEDARVRLKAVRAAAVAAAAEDGPS